MSEAELLQKLETLTPDALERVAERITILQERDELTSYEREILEKRMADYERDKDKGDPWPMVRERIMAKLKK
jgi:hypothetical protein